MLEHEYVDPTVLFERELPEYEIETGVFYAGYHPELDTYVHVFSGRDNLAQLISVGALDPAYIGNRGGICDAVCVDLYWDDEIPSLPTQLESSTLMIISAKWFEEVLPNYQAILEHLFPEDEHQRCHLYVRKLFCLMRVANEE
ncbi:CUN027 hypothetical protein [Culex nigripalpus nucleopolyhedrovirus]|uniref:Uncharacterized protein n=1 Tax=Culex nigripalpus nucleopolyhedrovirus (isolate Florida/1997) TaxID=645993 RepID=Q919P2_NPVCO|nr:CUN027 hypothetical protein [Culex nigripalpus nucleopolyhedrovirus]AAK94105.1 CUN027 hypothetical protein [Culex nigripalpus nucleopolyhedrovirus]